jgi:hypothetical protein
MSHWTSLTFLTWSISEVAEILSGFTSMLCLVMMYPRSLPRDLKGALFSVQPNVETPEISEGFIQVGNETTALPCLHDNVIDIDFHVATYLPFKTGLHTPLVGGPHVL